MNIHTVIQNKVHFSDMCCIFFCNSRLLDWHVFKVEYFVWIRTLSSTQLLPNELLRDGHPISLENRVKRIYQKTLNYFSFNFMQENASTTNSKELFTFFSALHFQILLHGDQVNIFGLSARTYEIEQCAFSKNNEACTDADTFEHLSTKALYYYDRNGVLRIYKVIYKIQKKFCSSGIGMSNFCRASLQTGAIEINPRTFWLSTATKLYK